MSAAVANEGVAAGLTWMNLDAVIVVPQTVAVHVSVTSPPHAPGIVLKVDMTVPVSWQLPVNPLSYVSSWVVAPPQATVMAFWAGNDGVNAGLTWIILEVVITLPQTVAVHVSVTSPPQAPGRVLKVDLTVPVSWQLPVKPLSYVSSWVVAPPHATVIADWAGNDGVNAGLTWMIREVVMVLPHTVAVHVSVTSPPHAPGMVVKVELTVPVS